MCHRLVVPVAAALVAAISASTIAVHASPTGAEADIARVRSVVDSLKTRLELPQDVSIVVVTHNPLVVSVDPTDASRTAFQMSFEQGFLGELNDAELEAVVAHELGHVWIYTHHPYLHTEQLANEVAMRVVDRAVLDRVYLKVEARGERLGGMERFTDR